MEKAIHSYRAGFFVQFVLNLEPIGISMMVLNSFGVCSPAMMSCDGWDTVLKPSAS